jgi:Na+/proline symporter
MMAYMVKGIGLFLSMFLPFSPLVCSLMMIGVATVYTMVSGFYGVVFTDMFQSVIILIAVISISLMAFLKVGDTQALAALARSVTNNSEWLSSVPHIHTSMPKGYEVYQNLFMFAIFYMLRNIFYGMAGGDDPKYFGARNDRECGTLTFLWTWLMMFRWPMMMGFAILGLFLVKDLFPDQAVLLQAADLIKQHIGEIDQSRWADVLAGIMNNPQEYPKELIAGLGNLLGDDWVTRLHLLSFEGTVNPERILPAVILFNIPKGLRGMLLVALIAASMSTFDSTVNKTTGFFTRDIYQRYLRPRAGNSELIYASWAFGVAVVALGFLMGYTVKSINDIWDWIIMALGGGLLIPLFLRLYWWRFNGGGFAIGTVVGLVGAVVMRILTPYLVENWQCCQILLDPRWQFVIMLGVGLVGALSGTYLTQPTEPKVLEHFYRTTRPFGFWGHLKNTVSPEVRAEMVREHRNDLLALPFTLGWQITLFLLPMQLIVHTFKAFWITFVIFVICLTGMYFFWYRNLDSASPRSE